MKWLWKIVKYTFLAGVVLGVLIVGINFWVIVSTENQVFYRVENTPQNKVALILGTSKRTSAGDSNKYFHERIAAAAELYHNDKIKHIIVSGDNRSIYYNEPRDMYQALVNLNVPKGVITLDFAGLRTLDSIVRADSIFGQKKFTIVTQDFHCYRSLFIANYYGLEVIGYSADDKEQLPLSLAIREIFARFAAVLDLYIWKKAPSILGEKEKLNL
ncbi:MAG: ElyC/SanA/YdcF family protein [Cyclobacteriaceae bacterium]